eukprot:100363_1
MSESQLKLVFKSGGIGLAILSGYKTMTNGFSNSELKAISAFTAINEFLFFYFFDKVFANDPDAMKNKSIAKKIIFGAVLFYGSPIFLLSNADYTQYIKYVYTAIFVMKCLVGTPFLKKLKLTTMQDVFLFLNFVLAVSYGLITRQIWKQ